MTNEKAPTMQLKDIIIPADELVWDEDELAELKEAISDLIDVLRSSGLTEEEAMAEFTERTMPTISVDQVSFFN